MASFTTINTVPDSANKSTAAFIGSILDSVINNAVEKAASVSLDDAITQISSGSDSESNTSITLDDVITDISSESDSESKSHIALDAAITSVSAETPVESDDDNTAASDIPSNPVVTTSTDTVESNTEEGENNEAAIEDGSLESFTEQADTFSDETMFSLPRMAEFLRDGSEAQKLVLIFELSQLFRNCPEGTLNIILPVVCEEVAGWSEEVQVCAAEALLDLRTLDMPADISKMLCSAAFGVLRGSSSGDMFEAWGEILVIVMPYATGMKQGEVISLIQTIDGFVHSREDVRRKLAARVLGSMSICVEQEQVEEYILPRTIHLTADRDVEARGMAAESLSQVGSHISLEKAESDVWPILTSLLEDEDSRIHAATLRTMSSILETFRDKHRSAPLFRKLLPPVFVKECLFAQKVAGKDQRALDDDTYLLLEIIAEVFGSFLFSAFEYITELERKEACIAYWGMARCNGPIVRRHCAFNMPGIAKCMVVRYSTELATILDTLAKDSDAQTRWTLAAGINETVAILGKKTNSSYVFRAVTALLKDENPLVRVNVLEHFCKLLETIVKDSGSKGPGRLALIFQNLTLLSEGNWRTQEMLAKQLEDAAVLIPGENLRLHVLPLLVSMAEESTFRVRKAVMPAIARVLCHIPTLKEREKVIRTFCMEWGNGGVYWMRTAFVDCALAARDLINAEQFKALFVPTLLRLVHDNVVNVRLCIAKVIHELASICQNEPRYKEFVDMLKEDTDADIRDAMKGVEDRIAVVMGEILDEECGCEKGEERKEEEEEVEIEVAVTNEAEKEERENDSPTSAERGTLQKRITLPKLRLLKSRNSSPRAAAEVMDETGSPTSDGSSPGARFSPRKLIAGLLQSPRKSREAEGNATPESTSPLSLGRRALRMLFGQNLFGLRKRQSREV